ncbi:uncharacterized protein LOC120330965 [Styela clava]
MSRSLRQVDPEDGVAFKYYRKKVNFTTANEDCKILGSHLAIITDENSFKEVETNVSSHVEESYWWLGLQRRADGWKWLNDEELQSNVLDFTGDTGMTNCASLFKPARSKKVYLYDYSCNDQNMYFICQTDNSVSGSKSSNHGPLSSGSIVAILLGITILISLLIYVIIRRYKRRRSLRNSRCHLNQQRTEAIHLNPTNIASQKPRQEGDYATINDDPGYATIDTVIYTEVVDENYCDEEQNGVEQSEIQATYAKVNKERKSSNNTKSDTDLKTKNEEAPKNISEQYAKVTKRH